MKHSGWWNNTLGRSAEFVASSRDENDELELSAVGPDVWTMPLMKQAAAFASARTLLAERLGHHDARDVAWEGVALAVAENPQVTWSDAIYAGQVAISEEFSQRLQIRGTVKTPGGGYHTTPRFVTYWHQFTPSPLPPNHGDTRRALWQAWDALDPDHQRALMTRAVTTTDGEAALLYGLSQTAMSKRIRAARHAFLALWFDHETPPSRPITPPRRVLGPNFPCGHDRATNTAWKNRRKGQRRVAECRKCARVGSAQRNTQRRSAP